MRRDHQPDKSWRKASGSPRPEKGIAAAFLDEAHEAIELLSVNLDPLSEVSPVVRREGDLHFFFAIRSSSPNVTTLANLPLSASPIERSKRLRFVGLRRRYSVSC